jgi:hypothetical protein
MTLEQIADLTKTLDSKVEEGLETLKTTPISSPEYDTILKNIVSSTTLANKIRMDSTPLQTTKGAA